MGEEAHAAPTAKAKKDEEVRNLHNMLAPPKIIFHCCEVEHKTAS